MAIYKVIKFNKQYFFVSFILLAVLVYIALFVHDQFVRPFMGDVLVVIWLYLLSKSFVSIDRYKLAHFVLLFAYAVEIAQFYNLVAILGLEHIRAARIIIGSTFDWLDLLAYSLGWVFILCVEYRRLTLQKRK